MVLTQHPLTYSEKITFEEMIELIHRFPFTTEFFAWLAEDDLEVHNIHQRFHENTYERIGEFFVHNIRFFEGGAKFYLDKIFPEFTTRLQSDNLVFYSLLPELVKLNKKIVAQHLSESNYTVISDLYYKEETCGSSWEIFDLSKLIHIYHLKKKPS